jgi:hypothetical protein
MLLSQQHADLAKVAITAAEREKKRAQAAWEERVISERDYRRALDEVTVSQACAITISASRSATAPTTSWASSSARTTRLATSSAANGSTCISVSCCSIPRRSLSC